MSPENVEIVRRLNAVFNDAPRDVERWIPYYHPDAEFRSPPEWPEADTYRGRDGIEELALAWAGSFEEYRWDEEEVFDAGEDVVVGLWHHRGQLPGSDEWVERRVGTVWYLREGKIERVLSYFSWDQALEAADVPGRRRA
jgi:ketosteroid isomerase-like protein